MTWGSLAAKALSLVVVLPLVLTRFTTEEIALWYLFSTIIGLQLFVDIGFSPTFSRLVAYGMGGATSKDIRDVCDASKVHRSGQPNWKTIEKICSTMRAVYSVLAVVSIFFLAILGTWALIAPISATANLASAWLAWGVILLASTFTLWGNTYSAYLQGVNQIALLRRWEVFTSLGAIATSCAVLVLGGSLLGLVMGNQGWVVLNILRNRCLCGMVEEGRFQNFTGSKIDPDIFDAAWPSAWRSGVGVFMGYGLIQVSGIIYAQVSSASEAASYLLALRLLQVVSQFSQAPFYSKLPVLARLRAEGNIEKQISVAKRGMALAYWTYVGGFLFLGIFASLLMRFIGSNTEFVSPSLWALMGLSGLAERYGAMHIQLYSTTNHIIWHMANGVAGIIYLAFSLALFDKIGVYAFPVSTLAGYLGFYCGYSAKHSYQAFGLKLRSFESGTLLVPFSVMLIYIGIVLASF